MKLPLITRHKQQQGVALLSIMLILTLMTLIVAEVTFSYRNQLRKTTGRQQLEQARWYALSAEELAIRVLKQSFDDDDGVIHLGQYWAKEGMVFPVENGSIAGEIRDSQGCFNKRHECPRQYGWLNASGRGEFFLPAGTAGSQCQ